jgi:surface polysaccharide O-acyltransferase-like enzyme
MVDKNANKQWLDSLRALAVFGVILIHISSPAINMNWSKNLEFWWIANLFNSAVRFAVPLFLMLSGATLLTKDYNVSDFYKRRVSRVLIPFLFWMLVYLAYYWYSLPAKQQPHEFQAILQWATDLFLRMGVSKHFWYIYMIVFIYLFVPFIGKLLRKMSQSSISNLLLLWVVLAFVFKSSPLNMYGWSGDYGSKFLGYFLYSGYLILGYYLMRLKTNLPNIRIFAALIFVMCSTITSVFTFYFSTKWHKLDLSLYSYLTVNTIIQTISIFLLIKDSTIKNKIISWITKTISDYSYGIYLVHIIVISLFFDRGIYWNFAYPLISIPVLTLAVLVCSFAIIFVVRKIPFLKYISG